MAVSQVVGENFVISHQLTRIVGVDELINETFRYFFIQIGRRGRNRCPSLVARKSSLLTFTGKKGTASPFEMEARAATARTADAPPSMGRDGMSWAAACGMLGRGVELDEVMTDEDGVPKTDWQTKGEKCGGKNCPE